MGSDRTCSYFFSWSNLFRPLLVLWNWRYLTGHLLGGYQEVANVTIEVPNGTPDPGWRWLYPTSNTAQLSLMGHRRVHLPEAHSTEIFRLVVTTQLPHKRWT